MPAPQKLGRAEIPGGTAVSTVINGDQGITLKTALSPLRTVWLPFRKTFTILSCTKRITYQHVTKQVEEGEQPVPFYVEEVVLDGTLWPVLPLRRRGYFVAGEGVAGNPPDGR